MRRTIWVTALLVFCPLLGFGQDSLASWENLKSLRVGQKIEVTDRSMNKVKARFRGLSGDGMTIDIKHKKNFALERDRIVMVSVPTPWFKRALSGLLIGAILSTEALAEIEHEKRDFKDCDDDRGDRISARSAAYLVGASAGVGGLAAAFSGGSGKVIYFHNAAHSESSPFPESDLQFEKPFWPEYEEVFAPLRTKEKRGNNDVQHDPAKPD